VYVLGGSLTLVFIISEGRDRVCEWFQLYVGVFNLVYFCRSLFDKKM